MLVRDVGYGLWRLQFWNVGDRFLTLKKLPIYQWKLFHSKAMKFKIFFVIYFMFRKVTVLSLQGGWEARWNREADDPAMTHVVQNLCPGGWWLCPQHAKTVTIIISQTLRQKFRLVNFASVIIVSLIVDVLVFYSWSIKTFLYIFINAKI